MLSVAILLGCWNKLPYLVACKQQKVIARGSGCWEVQIKAPDSPQRCGRGEKGALYGSFFYKGTNPIHEGSDLTWSLI